MIARGQGGKIINMASQAGRRGEPLVAAYCATKAAVISLTQSAGLDLIRYGINVNAIRSEEHTSELQSLMRISYAVFCLKKKKYKKRQKEYKNKDIQLTQTTTSPTQSIIEQ